MMSMARQQSKSLPDFATLVRTYAELEQFATAFADGYLTLLILLGPPGTGKSWTMREVVGGNACWIDGSASAFGVYKQAYWHRDEPIVLDDAPPLGHDRQGNRLLKALCQTDARKRVCWHSNAPALVQEQIPREFETTSHVAIIANQWRSGNIDVAALEDRGHVLYFAPTAEELHRQAAQFFWDQPIYDFIGERLDLIESPSLRTYVVAAERKRAGLDWKAAVLGRFLTGTSLVVAMLKANPNFDTEEDRARAFVKGGHGCRATFFNVSRALRVTTPAPENILTNTAPPSMAPRQILKFDQPDILRSEHDLGRA